MAIMPRLSFAVEIVPAQTSGDLEFRSPLAMLESPNAATRQGDRCRRVRLALLGRLEVRSELLVGLLVIRFDHFLKHNPTAL